MSGPKAPKGYQPMNQAAADKGFFGALNTANAQTGSTAAIANPGYDSAYSGVANNPFDPSMIAGIAAAAGNAGRVGAADLTQAGALQGQAGQGYADANAVRALADPVAADASTVRGIAPQFDALAALAKGYADPMTADANMLRSYEPYLAEMGLDPNFSEYNYGLKQTEDTQNVASAEQGVAGSPFAAGLEGDAMAAYKRNYDASRATRAMQALAALSGLSGSAANLDAGALGALGASGDFTTAGIGARTAAAGLDTTSAGLRADAGNIAGNAAGLAATASDLGNRGVQTEALGAQMPYAAVNQEFMDRMQALDELVNGRLSIANSEQQSAQGYNSYLQTGQNATQLAQNAAKINAQNSFMGGLMSLVGTLGSSAIQAGVFKSDIRLKTNIRRVGALPSGLPLYRFAYKNPRKYGHGEYEGVMAHEARLVFPDAVIADADGMLMVDYSKVR